MASVKVLTAALSKNGDLMSVQDLSRELTFFSWTHNALGSSSVTIQSYLIPTTFSEVVKSLQLFFKIKS